MSYPGGYADAVVVPATALARIPEEFTAPDAAPMGCAGVTVFNALRTSAARPGDLVAILGIGGLGHLGVQFAARLGFETIAIARGADKNPWPSSWEPTTTSTTRPRTPPLHCRPSAGPRWCSAP